MSYFSIRVHRPEGNKWKDFFTYIARVPADLAVLVLTSNEVEFIRDNTYDRDMIAHGMDEVAITLAVTAVEVESERVCWFHLYQIIFGIDAGDVIFSFDRQIDRPFRKNSIVMCVINNLI